MYHINETLRARRWDLSATYRRISARESWLACHWVHAIFRLLQADPAACRSPEDLVSEVLTQQMPQALAQWDFFCAKRDAIESLVCLAPEGGDDLGRHAPAQD